MIAVRVLPFTPPPPFPGTQRVWEGAEGHTVVTADVGTTTVFFQRHLPDESGEMFLSLDVDVLRYVLRRVDEDEPPRELHRPADVTETIEQRTDRIRAAVDVFEGADL